MAQRPSRAGRRPGLASRLLDALVAAVVAALLLAAVIALSAGPIGPGRLAHVGANAVLVAPFLAMGLAVGAMPVAALATWRRRRRLSCEISREETSREPVSRPSSDACSRLIRRSKSDWHCAWATCVLAPARHSCRS